MQTQKSCKPCEKGVQPFSAAQSRQLLLQLEGWSLDSSGKILSKKFVMKNFKAVLDFIEQIGALAEKEGHHPDLHLTRYRNLEVVLSTHAIGGLSENDFILAGKIDLLPKVLK